MKGRVLGKRHTCKLCGRTGYEHAGHMRILESALAYHRWPWGTDYENRVVWLAAGDVVCGHHIAIKPQPPKPEVASLETEALSHVTDLLRSTSIHK